MEREKEMKRCERCDTLVADKVKKCPACGRRRLYYSPSQEQVWNEAEAIQLGWSEGVRKSREVSATEKVECMLLVRAPARGRSPGKGLFSYGRIAS